MNQQQKGYLIMLLLVFAMVLHYSETDRMARMAGGPAEAYCLSLNYTSAIRENSAGFYDVCIVDGTEWELWNYYRTQVPATLANCTINTTVAVWSLENGTCSTIDGCGADYISTFATESQCRAVAGEAPLVEEVVEEVIEEVDQPIVWWVLEEETCTAVGPQVDPPEGEDVLRSLDECNQRKEDKYKYTSEVNPNIIEKVKQIQAQQKAVELQREESEEPEPALWQTTKFWITLIIVLIIAIIYGLWEKGPKKGLFRRK